MAGRERARAEKLLRLDRKRTSAILGRTMWYAKEALRGALEGLMGKGKGGPYHSQPHCQPSVMAEWRQWQVFAGTIAGVLSAWHPSAAEGSPVTTRVWGTPYPGEEHALVKLAWTPLLSGSVRLILALAPSHLAASRCCWNRQFCIVRYLT